MGPGKVALLRAIAAHGSISAAGRALGMSYKRAWDLVNTMNHSFKVPVVAANKGGSGGGGAGLTEFGHQLVEQYDNLTAKADAAIEQDLKTLLRHLQKD